MPSERSSPEAAVERALAQTGGERAILAIGGDSSFYSSLCSARISLVADSRYLWVYLTKEPFDRAIFPLIYLLRFVLGGCAGGDIGGVRGWVWGVLCLSQTGIELRTTPQGRSVQSRLKISGGGG